MNAQIEQTGQDRYSMTGDLTIKGNTRPVTFQMVKYGEFNDPNMMGHRISYSTQAKINRKNFGLTFNMMLDGKWIISDEVEIRSLTNMSIKGLTACNSENVSSKCRTVEGVGCGKTLV
jgi:polyisoprenoid-binding protein YceI